MAEKSYRSLQSNSGIQKPTIESLGLSPVQLFLGRMLKTDIPTAEILLRNDKMA
jgi:hypothetical protein